MQKEKLLALFVIQKSVWGMNVVSENLIVSIEEEIAADGRYTGGKGANLAKLFHNLGKDNVSLFGTVYNEFATLIFHFWQGF